MKRFISKLLAAALAVMLFAAPVCALAAQPITITSVTDNGDATTTITWDNPNSGTVTVGSIVYDSGEAGNQIIADFEITGNTYTFRNLAPQVDYLLLVCPGTDLENAGVVPYTPPAVGDFDDFYFTLQEAKLAYFVPKGDSYSYNYADSLSNSEIYDLLDEKQFWVKVDFDHVTYTNDFTFSTLTVVTSPTGYVVTVADDLEIPKYTTGFWQTMVYMNDALAIMHEANGEIPTGEYNVQFYMDGRFAGEDSFTIKGR